MISPPHPQQVLPPQSDERPREPWGDWVVFWCFLQKVGTGSAREPRNHILVDTNSLIVEQNGCAGSLNFCAGLSSNCAGSLPYCAGYILVIFSSSPSFLSFFLIKKEKRNMSKESTVRGSVSRIYFNCAGCNPLRELTRAVILSVKHGPNYDCAGARVVLPVGTLKGHRHD